MSKPDIVWRQLDWSRPLDPVAVAACLRNWAADARSPRIVLETTWQRGVVTHRIGYRPVAATAVVGPLLAFPNLTSRRPATERAVIQLAGRIRATTRHRPLRLNDPESTTRALYAAGVRLGKDEAVVLQVVLGPRRVPMAVPNSSPASVVQPWWSTAWLGPGGQIDGERRSALRSKVGDHGFACSVRLGTRAADIGRQRSLLLGLVAAVRVTEAPGVTLKLRREPARRLNRAGVPLLWPLRLGVAELTGLTAWPLGEAELPGQGSIHPKRLAPPAGTTGDDRVIADVMVPGSTETLALPIAAATHHLHVVGPTGTGKSTLLANLIAQDMADGHSVVVIEPKGDLVDDVLRLVPDGRRDDVVVLDPSDPVPVGLNPLHSSGRRPDLVADNILSVLKRLYGKNIGPRSSDILYAGLLTLAQRGDASLVMLPLLLTNPGFRRSLTKDIRDPLVLGPFWAGFERWSDAERANATAPVLNKLRPLIRPGLRGVLGQRDPKFDLGRVFSERTILLVPLQRGVIGSDAANLLGSMVVAELWQAIQARSSTPRDKRHPVLIYLDEAQQYLNLPVDLADALAQSRGYAVGWVLAHQFLSQFSRDMRAAVLANARSRIVFQTIHDDARVLERGHPEVTGADLTALGKYELYASLFANGQVQPYGSGRSRPLPTQLSDPLTIQQHSRNRFGRALDEVEQGFADLLDSPSDDLGLTGRRQRQQR